MGNRRSLKQVRGWLHRTSLALAIAGLAIVAAGDAAAAPATEAAASETRSPPSTPLRQPKGEYRVHAIDVDQGQATLIQTLDGKNILYDAGDDYASPRLVAYLKKVGVDHLDWLVLSHRHQDHIAGVAGLSQAIPVDNILTPWAKDAVPITAAVYLIDLRPDLSKPASSKNRPQFHTGTKGQVFNIGKDFDIKVLWPPEPTGGVPIGDLNEESMVVKLTQRDAAGRPSSFIASGDLGWQDERYIAQIEPEELVGVEGMTGFHHGSGGSLDRSVLEAVAGGPTPILRAMDGELVGDAKNSERLRLLGEGARKVLADYHAEAAAAYAAHKPRPLGPGRRFAARVARQVFSSGTAPEESALIRDIAATLPRDRPMPWLALSMGEGNPYGHPNPDRVALATLLGIRVLSTVDDGNVIQRRSTNAEGAWGERSWWRPASIWGGKIGLPSAVSARPPWKFEKDPKEPYDLVAREANYIFSLSQPDPTIPWAKVNVLRARGKTALGRFLSVVRQARQGRKAAEREYRDTPAADRPKLARVKAAGPHLEHPWCDAPMTAPPWDQGLDGVFKRVVKRVVGKARGQATEEPRVAPEAEPRKAAAARRSVKQTGRRIAAALTGGAARGGGVSRSIRPASPRGTPAGVKSR